MGSRYASSEEQEELESYKFLLKDLAKSGLNEDTIVKSGTYLPCSKGYSDLVYGVSETSYEIIYPDPFTGEATNHRRLKVSRGGPGFKYIQEKGTGNRLYYPNTLFDGWATVREAEEIARVIITEGEKKADAVCTHWNIPCIGLPGVCGWSAGNSRPLHDWDFIDWRRVDVATICFDSDVDQMPQPNASKDTVQQQALNVARLLIQKGCRRVNQVHLPLPQQSEKVGLDDFIVKYL